MSTTKKRNFLIEKIGRVVREMSSAQEFLKELKKALENCSGNTDLSEKIGKFAREMPEFEYLKHQADFIKSDIRKICSKELPVVEAIKKVEEYNNILFEALRCFDIEYIVEYKKNVES